MVDLEKTPMDAPASTLTAEPRDRKEDEAALAARVLDKTKRALAFHKPDWDRMLRDLVYHKYGADAIQSKLPDATWDAEGQYTANLISPAVRRFVSQVYAKNPKPAPVLEDRMDYTVWSGKREDAVYAANMIAEYEATIQAIENPQPNPIDPETGMEIPMEPIAEPVEPPEDAFLIVQEYNDWVQRKESARQIGNAITIALEKSWKRANFKAQAKLGVALARATSVSWVKVSFERKMKLSDARISTIRDHKDRLATIQRLIEDKRAGEADFAQEAELQFLIEDLEANPDVVLEEGLTYEILPYNRVIVDPECRDLETMRGCNWIAHVFPMTKNRIQEVFGKNVGVEGKTFMVQGGTPGFYEDTQYKLNNQEKGTEQLFDVYEFHDLKTRMVYVVCDAYEGFLREPSDPKVYFDQGHPFFPLTFDHLLFEQGGLYPHSAVYNMRGPQKEYNRARAGLIDNREHNAPLHAVAKGRMSEGDKKKLATAPAFSVIELDGLEPGDKVGDLFQRVPTTGVDNNQYDPSPFMDDFTRTGSESEAAMGAATNGSATEAAIGAQASASDAGDSASRVDDWMEAIAAASGKVLMMEMSREQMAKLVGKWALTHWPEGDITEEDVRNDVALSIVAGSSGRPDAAAIAATLQTMSPLLMATPGFKPRWLAKIQTQAISPAIDFDDAFDPALPSINSLNGAQAFEPAAAMGGVMGGAGGANNAPQAGRAPGGQTFPAGAQPAQMQKLRSGI